MENNQTIEETIRNSLEPLDINEGDEILGYRGNQINITDPQVERRLIFRPAQNNAAQIRNTIVKWIRPIVEFKRNIIDGDEHPTDPEEYVRLHGPTLIPSAEINRIARGLNVSDKPVQQRVSPLKHRLVGDLDALRLFDLDRVDLRG